MKTLKMYKKGAPEGAPFLEIMIADTFYLRLRGLMGRKKLPETAGLLLAPCNSVHMCFMHFPIDVVYLDKEYRIIKIVKNLRPWFGLSMCRKAWATLELNAGKSDSYILEEGNTLTFQKE